jgi:hypothetical protein
VSDDNLDALIAELRAIDVWDRLQEGAPDRDEIDKAGSEARQMRRLEIIDAIRCSAVPIGKQS